MFHWRCIAWWKLFIWAFLCVQCLSHITSELRVCALLSVPECSRGNTSSLFRIDQMILNQLWVGVMGRKKWRKKHSTAALRESQWRAACRSFRGGNGTMGYFLIIRTFVFLFFCSFFGKIIMNYRICYWEGIVFLFWFEVITFCQWITYVTLIGHHMIYLLVTHDWPDTMLQL